MKKNKYIFLIASVVASQFFVSCNEDNIDKVNSPIPYEAIGGYDNSDDVAASNLISKLSFENDLTDSKGAITGTVNTNVGFVAGKKGMAYNGSSSQHRYAVGNASASITGLNDFTFSFWMKTANTVPDGGNPGQGKGAQGIFTIVRPTEFWGGLNLYLENPNNSFPNRLRLKLNVDNKRTGVVWTGQSVIMNIDNSLNTWVHVLFTYNSSSSTVSAYINGVLCANLSDFPYCPAGGVAGETTWYSSDPGDFSNKNSAPKYGAIEMKGTNGKVVLGTHQFDTTPAQNNGGPQGWATSYAGLLDEFRIYKSALSVNEVKALYLLEKDNR